MKRVSFLSRTALLVIALVMAVVSAGHDQARVLIDYPLEGSVFPPEITAPTFRWRDAAKAVTVWSIEVSFADGSAALHATSTGDPPRIGPIDRNCVADTNELPALTPEEAASHNWVPPAELWERIKLHSVPAPATVTITGHGSARPGSALSTGSARIRTSRDPAGAPIFYRDVPLMPSESKPGVIKPLAASAVPLVAWRLRNLAEPGSRTVLDDLPVCANCHSFSADGKTMGMDLDGLQNNRGLYILAKVRAEMQIGEQNLVQWRTASGTLKGSVRAGFMSQVSPDGRFVATTINPLQAAGMREAPSNYYVVNFKDYRFLQVFYPARGILSWYSAASGMLQPLPGADDRRYVQMGGVWSADGRELVFARAAARDPNASGLPLAEFANDPNELQMRYDLYRIPFREGRGGHPEPIAGASQNGASNSFPKVSPDGRWIVFVKARNGLLMRPDSELYIVPAGGGEARRMRCNLRLMNSWHSFSPNARWLVFSSKARSPYTQMYLTHIDTDGNDSPAILIENTTAANRAVNLPEFVKLASGGLRRIGGPALDYFRAVDSATYYQKRGQLSEAVGMWALAVKLKPEDALAHGSLGNALLLAGRREEAAAHLETAAELKLRAAVADRPDDPAAYGSLGRLLRDAGRTEEAVANLRRAVVLDPNAADVHGELALGFLRLGKLDESFDEARTGVRLAPGSAPAHYVFGLVLEQGGGSREAIAQFQRALQINPGLEAAHDALANSLFARGDAADALAHWRRGTMGPDTLRRMAWVLATCPVASVRNGREAITLAARALQLSKAKSPALWDTLAAAYAEADRWEDAVLTARRGLEMAQQTNQADLVKAIEDRIRLYRSGAAFRAAAIPSRGPSDTSGLPGR